MIKPTKPEPAAAQPGAGVINETIKASSMRVISPTGEVLGVLSKRDALEKAREFGLDLVCVSPNTDPVVCKIMDFGKHLYKLKKKAKKAKANQVTIEIKELKIRPNTDTHDLMTKINHAKKFLEDGNKVKFTWLLFNTNKQMQDIYSGRFVKESIPVTYAAC